MQFQNKEFIIMLVIFIIIATVIILLSRRKKDDDNKELQKNINYENYENYNNKELQKNINYENYENYENYNNNTVQTNFCTCRNVGAKNCLPVADRLNNYKNGLTELSKLPKDDGWQSIMPYDIFEKMPEKDKHRINKLPSFV